MKEVKTKSELQRRPQNTTMRTSYSKYDDSRQNVPSSGNLQDNGHQQEMKKVSTFATEKTLKDGTNNMFLKPTKHSADAPYTRTAADADKNFIDALFDGSWRSAIPSVSSDLERKVSSESIGSSEISSISLQDSAPSLDDVFDDLVDSVLDEMDSFGSGLGGIVSSSNSSSRSSPCGMLMPFSGSFITPSIPLMDENESHRYNSHYQLPNTSIMGHSFDSSFQGLNFGLQNPSRGLITVMKKLCELLSKPRSDHLDSIFVRHLNDALREMEDAAQPQGKRSRKKSQERHTIFKRRKIRPSESCKSTIDYRTWLQSAHIRPRTPVPFTSRSYPSAISKGEGTGAEAVDLTGVEDNKNEKNCQRQQERHMIQDEPLIALEDTVSELMSSLVYQQQFNSAKVVKNNN